MEKLLELLNQYTKEEKDSDIIWELDNDGDICTKYQESVDYNECVYYAEIPVLISKSYGFIKRLVDNDRIDFYKDKYGINFYENGVQKFLKSEEEILMELSIQESPIEYLLSILK